MKIILPENIADITLEQYQKDIKVSSNEAMSERKKNNALINIYTGIDLKLIDDIPHKDKVFILNQIEKAKEVPSEFKQRFTLNEIEFGMIPNLNELTGAEFADIHKYQNDIEQLHRLMAILFRPIKKTDKFGNYSITKYHGTSEYSELMKSMPLVYVNGVLAFFLNLSNDLRDYIQQSTMEELARVVKH